MYNEIGVAVVPERFDSGGGISIRFYSIVRKLYADSQLSQTVKIRQILLFPYLYLVLLYC